MTDLPRCELRGTVILDVLPPSCPLKSPDPHKAATELADRAFARALASPSEDGVSERIPGESICQSCVSILLGHRLIAHIRRAVRREAVRR